MFIGGTVLTVGMEDDRPPICPACGVTMLPSEQRPDEWVCAECEDRD
jgi:tRNA(Ile2) C34 agmatinyltransferase TiaS